MAVDKQKKPILFQGLAFSFQHICCQQLTVNLNP
ncbi:hypothetical protein M2391_001284 [Myroides odoratus]|nr:hypothetical protein [Myroides odoratus]